jgi:pimeloyl-ACP methyl ester carboxylesterase
MTTSTLAADQYVAVNGLKIRYIEAGSGTPLVMVHGLSVHEPADQWRKFFDELGEHFHCYALDLPGWGLSEMPLSGYSFRMWIDSVAGLVDALGLQSVDLMAYSFGSWIAGLYAAENPGRVRRFVSLHNPGLNKIVSQYHPADDVELPSLDRLRAVYKNDEVAEKVHAEMDVPGRAEAHSALLHVISDPAMREEWSLRHHLAGMSLPIFSADRDDGFVEGTVEVARSAPNVRLMISASKSSMAEMVTAGKEFLLEAEPKFIGKLR